MAAIVRARMLKDQPVVGEGMPMHSASDDPFNVNDVVYSFSTSLKTVDDDDGYDEDEDDGLPVQIIPHRVIQVNYQDRYVRVRCGNGCEATINFASGSCGTERYYHDLNLVKKLIAKKILEKKTSEEEKADRYLTSAQALQKLAVRASKIKPVPPKAIPVKAGAHA